jgi:ribosome-binding factor A
MSDYSRLDRVGDFIQQELARMIQFEVRDPRIGMVMVNEVRVSRDLSHARVFVTFVGREDEGEIQEALEALNKASGYLRTLLSKINNMRVTPRLIFVFDESIRRGATLSSLIDRALDADESMKKDSDDQQGDDGKA